MGIEAKKVANVEFTFDVDRKIRGIRFLWKKGKLYLSISSVFLNSDNIWYEIPVSEIEGLEMDPEGRVLTLHFSDGHVHIHSKNVESLMAFRHFLLPYVINDVR
jgi:hypothetical protein